ncbi:Actin-like protein arp8 [Orobanche hederae]
MNSLIRKLWISMIRLSRSPSVSGCFSNPNRDSSEYDRLIQTMYLQTSLTGNFDRIPVDIFMQIVKILGPRESATLRANQVEPWDSVFFAETHLRSGYPLQKIVKGETHIFFIMLPIEILNERVALPAVSRTVIASAKLKLLSISTLDRKLSPKIDFPAQMRDLSFMHIFGQRVEVPGALIIDGGSGYCKYGWSKYHCPSGRSATFLEFGSIESPMTSKLKPFYLTICNRMQVKTSTQPIVVSLPLCHYDDTESAKGSRRQLKNAIYTTLFDMNVPAVCAINQATLALFAARHTSGIVVNVGFNQTSIVPILRGKVMYKVGVEVVGMGALKLTGFLRDRMQQNNIHFDSLYTVRTLKENLCYVAIDYEAELSKDTEASFAVPSDTWFSLSKERFQTGEILFQPRMAGVQAMGLHQAVALCMDHCHDAELPGDDNWFKTVVLAGGTASLPGLAARLEKELYGLLPAFISDGIRVIPPSYGADSAWFGAKLISNDEQLSKILVHDEKAIPALAQADVVKPLHLRRWLR